MRRDNAIASSDARGAPQQPTPADPAESALERYLAVIADADKSEPPAQHSAQVGPKVVSEVMTVGVVSAHEQAGFKVIVASLVRNRISAVPVIDDARKVIGVVSESDLLRESWPSLITPPSSATCGTADASGWKEYTARRPAPS